MEGKADIAWFGYKPEERGLVAIPMGYNVSFLVASANILKVMLKSEKVSDLINHPIIMRDTGNESFSQVLQCEYSNYEIGRDHKVLYGDSDACKKLLIEGKGIAIDMNPNFIAEELLDGTVQPSCPGGIGNLGRFTFAAESLLLKIRLFERPWESFAIWHFIKNRMIGNLGIADFISRSKWYFYLKFDLLSFIF